MQGELVCAWCNKKKKDVQLVTQGKSHGICPTCLKRIFGFTVKQMHAANLLSHQQARLATAKKRRKRAQEKRTGAPHVR